MPDERSPPTALTWAVAPAVLEKRGRATARPSRFERYEDRGLIGVGGMGEVRRVFDRRLDCIVAMKLLAPELVGDAVARRRFVNEGTVTAQLRHPGIVAVHDRGELDDGRLWFTMTEVTGDTLGTHRPARGGPPDVQLRRWVAVLARVCEAMAYAHD
ncbi:MAG: protein kinase, partial [Myxococcota bacterium]